MLEVVFSDSAKGSMKAAKNYNNKNTLGGTIGYIGGKPPKSELEKRYEGKALGGSTGDVVCIGLNFDIGDITGAVDSVERKREFTRVFGSVQFTVSEIEQFFAAQREDCERLLIAAQAGEAIRVWISKAPFSACAFAFLCDALRNIDCNISTVSLPEYWISSENTLQSCTDWAELLPGQLYSFLSLERKLESPEKDRQSSLWNGLKSENAPLRALINGRLMSVPEDFYDHIIIKSIPDREFIMAQLIGTILGNHPLGVGDGWYSLRINRMIAENRLEIVSDRDASHPYGKLLRKTSLWH